MTFARRGRTALLGIAAAAYVASLAGVDDRLDAAETPHEVATVLHASIPIEPPSIDSIVRRDPFAEARHDPGRRATHPMPSDPVVPDLANMNADDAAPTYESPRATTLALRATIVGPKPVAFVANGASLQIVRLGDAVDGRRVVAIDLRGVAFGDGSRLDLGDEDRASEAPPAPTARVAIRRARRNATAHRSWSTAPPLIEPTIAPSPFFATPGPLRTVDPRGLPPGVNPTPDTSDPTAFPYPYPYPPIPH